MPEQKWIPAFAGMTNAVIDCQVHDSVMTLKILSIIVAMLLGLIVLAVVAAQIIVLGGFARLEQQNTYEHTERVLAALNENLDSLNSILGDWSLWDVVHLPEGPILLASQPILTSASEGPTAGTLILVRYFDDAERTRLSEVTRLPITVHAFDSPELPTDFQQARSAISPDRLIMTQVISDDTIAGYGVIPDIFGEPLLMLRVDVPRNVYKQGRTSVLYLAISLLIIGLLTLGALFVLLNRNVLNPLGQLQRDVNTISASGDLSQRVSLAGGDELGDFSRVLNNALDALQNSQERLQQAQTLEVVGRIAGGTAHEFNNILSIMLGTLELVMRNLPENNAERGELEQAYTAGQRGRDLVQQILIFSRTSLQTRQPLELQKIVHNALTLLKHGLPPTIRR